MPSSTFVEAADVCEHEWSKCYYIVCGKCSYWSYKPRKFTWHPSDESDRTGCYKRRYWDNGTWYYPTCHYCKARSDAAQERTKKRKAELANNLLRCRGRLGRDFADIPDFACDQ